MAKVGRPQAPETPEPRAVKPLTAAQIAEIAPLSNDGYPDMYNYMPTRFVPMDEAQVRDWPQFYDGRTCRYGHQSPRYTNNPRLCVDCKRIKAGKQPIGGKASGQEIEKARPYVKTENYDKHRETSGVAPKPLEPDALEKRFLAAYAAIRDLGQAAKQVGTSPAQIHARLSISQVFRAACNDLEARLNIKQTVPDPTEFEWDEDKRVRLITTYIDTGDIATARDAIRVTPSQLYKEIERNAAFASRLEEARPLADNALEERAIQYALAGNDKLLGKILEAKKSEYRTRVSVDMNVTEKLTDAQIEHRLNALLLSAQRRGSLPVIEAQFDESPGEAEASGTIGGPGQASESEQNLDLL